MDKIHKRLPIQHRSLRSPVIFAFNILTTHFMAFNTAHYAALQRIIQKDNNVDKFYLLPNITSVSMTIEERAAQLAHSLNELADREGFKEHHRAHLITHSFTGVDSRAALSLFGASAIVRSLSTVCSPHHGMRMVDNCNKHPNRYSIEMADKALEAVGLTQ